MKKQFVSIISVTLLLTACKTSTEENKFVTEKELEKSELVSVIEEIPGVSPEARIFTIPANEAHTIELPNGGSIVFPDNAFVDKEGNPVKGKVDVSWKEFHSLSDIILSGIPMKYDSAGVVHNFESGGMFTIQAKQGEKELELAPSKKAAVNLASISDSPCYNFYKIDEKTGDWDYLTTKTGKEIPSKEKTETKSSTQVKKPDQLLDVTPKNIAEIAALKGKTVVAWKPVSKLSGKDVAYLKNNVLTSTIKTTENPAVYTLETTVGKETKSFAVQPYMLDEALKNTTKVSKEQEKDFAEIITFQNNVAEGKVMRSIEISNFGTYNWDIISKMNEPYVVNATFKFPTETKSQFVSLFLVCPEMNAQIKIEPGDWKKFTFDKNKKQCIVGIMPDNSLVAFKNSSFNFLRKNKTSTHTFQLENTGMKLQKGQDLAILITTYSNQ